MKVELYPEDMLLEYVSRLLNGEIAPMIRLNAYIKHLPEQIEFSEEFAVKWQTMVEAAMKRFVASTFGLRPFLFDVEGYTKRFCVTDAAFWENVDLKFSHRGAHRLYELMIMPVYDIQTVFQVALPADAMLISVCIKDFSQYTFPWLLKNSASWLIKAVFMTWQQSRVDNLAWRQLLLSPSEVELPLRDYAIEKTADYLAGCTAHVGKSMEKKLDRPPRVYSADRVGGIEHSILQQGAANDFLLKYPEKIIEEVRQAITYWTGEGAVNIDDERFIAGASKNFGLDNEVAEFLRHVGMYREGIGMKEAIYESILRNQTTA